MELSHAQGLSIHLRYESMNINHHCNLSSNDAYYENSGALSASFLHSAANRH